MSDDVGGGADKGRTIQHLRPASAVISRRVDAGTVLIHLRTNRIYELNATGGRIWELLGEGRDADAIREQLQKEFVVEAAEARRAIEETFGMLEREGLVERTD